MVVASGGFGFGHDTFGRIIDNLVNGAVTRQFVYDGVETIAVFEPGAGLTERYVRGDGPDELIAWYDGPGTAARRWAHQDERGSVVAVSDGSGAAIAINRYDEYGKPQAGNLGRFQYTGQMWLSDADLYHYKNRAYAPHLGRFMQTDPIGTASGPNLYAYVGNDPVNWVDPLGLVGCSTEADVCGRRFSYVDFLMSLMGSSGSSSGVAAGGNGGGGGVSAPASNPGSEDEAYEQCIAAGGDPQDCTITAIGKLAQLVIPNPRGGPILPPWLFYDPGRRSPPPPPNNPNQSDRDERDGQCEAELAVNEATCKSLYPFTPFPSQNFSRIPFAKCMSEAHRVYTNCLTGKPTRTFDPYFSH